MYDESIDYVLEIVFTLVGCHDFQIAVWRVHKELWRKREQRQNMVPLDLRLTIILAIPSQACVLIPARGVTESPLLPPSLPFLILLGSRCLQSKMPKFHSKLKSFLLPPNFLMTRRDAGSQVGFTLRF